MSVRCETIGDVEKEKQHNQSTRCPAARLASPDLSGQSILFEREEEEEVDDDDDERKEEKGGFFSFISKFLFSSLSGHF